MLCCSGERYRAIIALLFFFCFFFCCFFCAFFLFLFFCLFVFCFCFFVCLFFFLFFFFFFFFFFSKNISIYTIFNNQSSKNTLANDIVSFEQLGPGVVCSLCGLTAARCMAFFHVLFCSLSYCAFSGLCSAV